MHTVKRDKCATSLEAVVCRGEVRSELEKATARVQTQVVSSLSGETPRHGETLGQTEPCKGSRNLAPVLLAAPTRGTSAESTLPPCQPRQMSGRSPSASSPTSRQIRRQRATTDGAQTRHISRARGLLSGRSRCERPLRDLREACRQHPHAHRSHCAALEGRITYPRQPAIESCALQPHKRSAYAIGEYFGQP